jgi:hypothetical protein
MLVRSRLQPGSSANLPVPTITFQKAKVFPAQMPSNPVMLSEETREITRLGAETSRGC